MKFMPQDMFEVCVLYLSKYKLLGDKAFAETKSMLHDSYKDSYKGDVLWLSQAEELVQDVHKLVITIGAKDPFKYLSVASDFRQKLDDNLEIPSKVKKFLGGTMFTSSHPAPSSRKEIAMKNFKRLFIMMAANGFVHD